MCLKGRVLLFQDQFFKVKRENVLTVTVRTHVSAGDFIDENNLIADFSELEFNVVKFDVLLGKFLFDDSGNFLGKLF